MPEQIDRLTAPLSGHYAVEREIGQGGMATVYLAEDLKHHRKVAVKVLLPELADLLGGDRFLREIDIAAKLTHPHILPLYDSGQVDGLLYYVMPYVEGASLRTRLLREHQLPVDEAVHITQQIAAALQYAHAEGVVHRDIKPENILLHRGDVMVADFGIALAIREAGGVRLTETGLSIGTPQYMSPEQASGDRQLDGRSDIYSLGCVCYEMLVGETPHTGPTAQAIIAKVLTETPPPIRTARDTVSPELEQVVLRSVARLAADRFSTAQELADALGSASRPSEIPASSLVTSAAPAERRPWHTGGAPWVVATLMTVLALWGWLRPDESRPVTRYRITFPEDQALLTDFALSPDGSSLAYVGPSQNGRQLWLKRRAEERATPLAGTGGAESPFFSPDGEWLGFFADHGVLKKVPLGGGGTATVARTSGRASPGAAWLADGSIVFVDDVYNIVRAPDAGGPADVITAFGDVPDLPFVVSLSALPDARGVLVTACKDICVESNVLALDIRDGTLHHLVEGGFGAWYVPSGHVLYGDRLGTVFAAPFDTRSLQLTGPGVPVLEGVSQISVSGSGTLLYVHDAGQGAGLQQLVWVERDGTASPIDEDWPAKFRTLALSPDGTRLAVSITGEAGQDLWVKQLDRGPATRLTRSPGLDRRPFWMPDGRSVMFQSERGDNRDLYVIPADGRSPAELVLDLPEHVDQGVWSPQADWLVYRTGITGEQRDISALRTGPDSTTMPVAVSPEFDEHSPAISADGRWLAYVSDESGRWEVYVRPFPDVDAARWQVSVEGGTAPVWAHSGRELFFRSDTAQMVVGVVTEPTFSPGTPQPLFSLRGFFHQTVHAAYDVTPDDQRFVMIQLRETGVGRDLVLVDNFFEELQTKLRAAGN